MVTFLLVFFIVLFTVIIALVCSSYCGLWILTPVFMLSLFNTFTILLLFSLVA